MEAATYAAAAAITRGDVTLKNVKAEYMFAVLEKLKEIGADVEFPSETEIRVIGREIQSADIVTFPYPGFPTDAQAIFTALLSVASGLSIITDTIYPDRFTHIAELNRMGANIRKQNNSAIILGADKLSGAPVMGSDLRAAACLALAGLVANGITEVHRIYHLDRGYEKFEAKLRKLGAIIERSEYTPRRRKSDRNAA